MRDKGVSDDHCVWVTMKREIHIGLIIACLMMALTATVAMAITPAGTKISATGSAKYYSTSGTLMPTVTSNTVTTTVSQVASVSISPTTASKTADSSGRASSAIAVTNSGNGSDSFDLSAAAGSGSSVHIYLDANGDGQWQSTETTTVANTGTLTPGASAKCVIVVELPSSTSGSDTITISAKSRFDGTKTAKATLAVQGEKDTSAYIRTWLLNGYYANTDTATRLSKDYIGGEANTAPSQGEVSGGKTWTKWSSGTEVIDLNAAFGARTYCAGYANVYVYSPSTQSVNLWLGSDNGIKVWVNGAVAWTNDSTRGLTVDQDKLTVKLNSGWNRLLVKVSQYGGAWAFTAKLCDGSGNAVAGLQYATDKPGTQTGTAQYIKDWLVNGYYPNTNNSTRLSTDYLGGEAGVEPYTGSSSGAKTWVRLSSSDGRYVDLAKEAGYPTYCAGYAHIYVYSPTAQDVSLWLGSDNGVKAWVNGEVVWVNDSTRGCTPDQDKAAVSLNEGWNRLLIKISQYGGEWGFTAKLCDAAGNAIPGLAYSTEPVSSYIRTWLLNGYYQNTNTATRLSTDYLGGESSVAPAQGSVSNGRTWTAVDSPSDTVDLVTAFGAQSYCAGYAHVYIYSPTERDVELRLGSDNGIKAWLNGSVIWTNDSTRGLTPDQDRVPMTLSQGWNRLLLKISQYGGSWLFTARICDSSGYAIPDLTFSADPQGRYIRSWLLNGYYRNTDTATRLSTDYLGGEASAAPLDGSVSGGNTWTSAQSTSDVVDLVKAFGAQTYVAAYACVYVYSPSDRTAQLLLGSDNGIKAWLNGSVIWTNDSARGLTADQDRVPVTLSAGWNRLMLKISQYGGNWAFTARFSDSSGSQIPDLLYSTSR